MQNIYCLYILKAGDLNHDLKTVYQYKSIYMYILT